ncbi:MAG: TrkH family potassium uptake protein, partial [Deltaproteobacteria bacterium]|nr:TrkH family potassium uptake protein [Deltaproteobacteria bacterium]
MNIRMLVNLLGRGLLFLSLGLLPCIVLSYQTRGGDLPGLISGFFISIATALAMLVFSFRPSGELRHREGFLFVTLAWSLAGVLGALPFWLSGYIPHYLDALFETVSGFTTTGATILVNVEALPQGLLLWRSLIQWLGGMGIIVLTIAILPYLHVGGMQIFKAESPGPTIDKLKPRITETAKLLWGIYVGLTFLEILLLMGGGLSWFDAVCHGFTTMATGGFSVKTSSIAAYNSTYVDTVLTIFMLLGGTSFALHYFALAGNLTRYVRSQEFRWYLILFAVSVLFILWSTR